MRAATKKAATFGATLWVPEFLRLEKFELHTLLHVLRDPLATHAYLLMLVGSVFETGEFLGGYHDMQALCTPPKPERGARMAGPTYDQLRRVVSDLVALALASRVTMQNRLQGQLRLQLTARKKKGTPEQLQPMIQPKVKKEEKLDSMRAAAASPADSTHDSTHGVQGVNTSFNGSKIGELSTTVEDLTSPPEGGQNGPHGPAPGQVEASPLMAGEPAPDQLTPQPPLHEGEQQPAFSRKEWVAAEKKRMDEFLAEREKLSFKERYAPSKPISAGKKPSRMSAAAPPAAQNQNSMVPIGNLVSGP